MTVAEWISQAESRLNEVGIPAARLEAQVLLSFAAGQDRSWVAAHGPDPCPAAEAAEVLLARRLCREPLAYITGQREFYGRVFRVGPGVLVPRQETELLVDLALRHIDSLSASTPRVLDLGTGSGILAITLKLERPHISIEAVDVSYEALDYARINAEALGAHVRFQRSDLFSDLHDEQFHIIVCNPPYVAREAELMPEVARFEPSLALFAEDEGFGIYRRLAREAAHSVLHEGVLIMELGDGMAGQAINIFEHAGWRVDGVKNDLGGTPRALCAAPLGKLL